VGGAARKCLCTTVLGVESRLAGSDRAGQGRTVVEQQQHLQQVAGAQETENSLAADANWVGRAVAVGELRLWPERRLVVQERPRSRAERRNARGSGSRADCAVLTRAGPMQGARAVECDRGTLSARRAEDGRGWWRACGWWIEKCSPRIE
jgi:hypothetical protein